MEVYNTVIIRTVACCVPYSIPTFHTCLDHPNAILFAHLSNSSTMLPTKKTNTLMESLISLLSTSVISQWSTNLLNNSLPSVVQHDTSEPWMDRRLSNIDRPATKALQINLLHPSLEDPTGDGDISSWLNIILLVWCFDWINLELVPYEENDHKEVCLTHKWHNGTMVNLNNTLVFKH